MLITLGGIFGGWMDSGWRARRCRKKRHRIRSAWNDGAASSICGSATLVTEGTGIDNDTVNALATLRNGCCRRLLVGRVSDEALESLAARMTELAAPASIDGYAHGDFEVGTDFFECDQALSPIPSVSRNALFLRVATSVASTFARLPSARFIEITASGFDAKTSMKSLDGCLPLHQSGVSSEIGSFGNL